MKAKDIKNNEKRLRCGDIKIDKMGRKYSTKMCPETHLNLIIKPPRQRQLRRRGCSWKNNIKNNFRDEGCGLDSIFSAYT